MVRALKNFKKSITLSDEAFSPKAGREEQKKPITRESGAAAVPIPVKKVVTEISGNETTAAVVTVTESAPMFKYIPSSAALEDMIIRATNSLLL